MSIDAPLPSHTTEPLHDLPVIVTGGASGLGAAVAERLLADGAAVTVLDRRAPRATIPAV